MYGFLTLDAGLLARSQYPEGPATGHLDKRFSWFPCDYKRMLRWFPSFQVATTCFSCSPPDLNFLVTFFPYLCTCKITTATGWQPNCSYNNNNNNNNNYNNNNNNNYYYYYVCMYVRLYVCMYVCMYVRSAVCNVQLNCRLFCQWGCLRMERWERKLALGGTRQQGECRRLHNEEILICTLQQILFVWADQKE